MDSYQDRLRNLREDKGLKQSDIAELIGTTQQQYSKYETGESELPLRALAILADYYDVSADYIMARTKQSEDLITTGHTVDSVISDILSLKKAGREAVIDYVFMQKLKEAYLGQKKGNGSRN